MVEFTTLILTFNERENIGRTIAALSWAKQIVIIDSFSTDEATEIAKALHANITAVQRRFDTHATQWNFGLAQIGTRWVLTLDADYELSRELSSEIAELKPSDEVSAYEAGFQIQILGGNLRFRVSATPDLVSNGTLHLLRRRPHLEIGDRRFNATSLRCRLS
jgi:glycosyltransferase involved in cell wall biosynthesis